MHAHDCKLNCQSRVHFSQWVPATSPHLALWGSWQKSWAQLLRLVRMQDVDLELPRWLCMRWDSRGEGCRRDHCIHNCLHLGWSSLKPKPTTQQTVAAFRWISGEGRIAAASTFTLFPKMSTLQLKLNNIIHMQMALLRYSQFIWLQFSCLSGGRSEILVVRASTATHFTAQVFISSVLSRWDAPCASNEAPAQARCWMQPSKSAGSSQMHQGQLQVWQELRIVTPQDNTSISAPRT